MNKALNMLKTTVEVILVMGFIFFEEFIWDRLVVPINDNLKGLKVLQRLQAKIELQGVYQILGIFIAIFILAEFMGIWAGGLILTGSLFAGIFVYALKIPVAALTFWMFGFSKPKLLTVDWFKTIYELLVRFFDWVKSTSPYKLVKAKAILWKSEIKKTTAEWKTAEGFSSSIKEKYKGMKKIFEDKKDTYVKKEASTNTDTSVKTEDEHTIVDIKETKLDLDNLAESMKNDMTKKPTDEVSVYIAKDGQTSDEAVIENLNKNDDTVKDKEDK